MLSWFKKPYPLFIKLQIIACIRTNIIKLPIMNINSPYCNYSIPTPCDII